MVLVGIAVAFLIEKLMPPPHATYEPISGYFIAVVITVLIWEGNLRIDYWLNRRLPWIKRPGTRLAIQFAIAMVYSSLALLIPMKAYNSFLCIIPPEREYLLNRLCLLIALAVSVILLFVEVSTQFFQNWKSSLLEVERYKTENVKAQLSNLKSQVNPHFLFNNLSVLSSLVYKDQDKAADFIQHLSKVYRYLLDSQQQELVPLKTEMEFIKAYLYLLQIRFDKNLIVNTRLEEEDLKLFLPPLALQILVENVIKHNEVSDEHPLHLEINSQKGILEVRNSLRRRSMVENVSGTGLRNIMERYRFFSDRAIEVQETMIEFIVRLPLLQSS